MAEHPTPPPIDFARHALFLDLDGTLAPIMPTPAAVAIAEGVLSALEALETALAGRLAVVSGRSIADVDALTGRRVRTVAGVHGLERRHGQRLESKAPAPGLAAARAEARALAQQLHGLEVEDKGLALALHYRAEPRLAALVAREADAIADRHGLSLQAGKMVVELKSSPQDKGDAVRWFMRSAPFAGAQPLFVGDDETDEPGFATCANLGGFGIAVGERPARAARFHLPDVDAVAVWLRDSLARVRAT